MMPLKEVFTFYKSINGKESHFYGSPMLILERKYKLLGLTINTSYFFLNIHPINDGQYINEYWYTINKKGRKYVILPNRYINEYYKHCKLSQILSWDDRGLTQNEINIKDILL